MSPFPRKPTSKITFAMTSEMPTSKDIFTSEHLNRVETAQSVNISMEMFEKLYLSPENKVKGDLRKTFANPILQRNSIVPR